MCFIRDLGSRNGTYVNGERTQEELLREGDRIVIGSTTLSFESDEDVAGDQRNIQFTEARDEDYAKLHGWSIKFGLLDATASGKTP